MRYWVFETDQAIFFFRGKRYPEEKCFKVFDEGILTFMASLSVGSGWSKWSPHDEQKAKDWITTLRELTHEEASLLLFEIEAQT